jgi:cell division protein FtsN
MSRDYKRTDTRRAKRGSGSSLLVGIFIGLVLGLGVALAVAWYINKMPSPFTVRTNPAGRSEAQTKAPPTQSAKVEEKGAKPGEPKKRFEFYEILPGTKEPSPEKGAPAASTSTRNANEAFFLQAGAFQSAPEADNLKARLALLGVEATIETTTSPDKGAMHRVRIGPYTSVEELNRIRETLKQNGVQTTLVKLREPER